MYEGVEMEAVGVQGVASGWALIELGCVLGDGCRGTHRRYRGEGGKPGILLSNSSRPGGLER